MKYHSKYDDRPMLLMIRNFSLGKPTHISDLQYRLIVNND